MITLPLVTHVVRNNANIRLDQVKVIGVQHILGTTHAMLRSLYELGLKPENVSLIGKCYSTNPDVLIEMRKEGVDVNEQSLRYSSHTPWDMLFDSLVLQFLSERLADLDRYERVIVLDDGGHFIQALSTMRYQSSQKRMICIEQTSSGINNISRLNVGLPIISVATCQAKRVYETPMIANAIESKLLHRLSLFRSQPHRCLVIGGGALGSHISRALKRKIDTVVYDINPNRSDLNENEFPSCLSDFDLVIGCTGTTSLRFDMHPLLSPGATLVSASSSDREFDAVYLRRQLPENSNCHADMTINGINLINSGFPINFDGARHSVAPSSIQFTRALLAGSVLQAASGSYSGITGIVPLAGRIQSSIVKEYLDNLSTSRPHRDGLFARMLRRLGGKESHQGYPIRKATGTPTLERVVEGTH